MRIPPIHFLFLLLGIRRPDCVAILSPVPVASNGMKKIIIPAQYRTLLLAETLSWSLW